ncbi:MAG TPA: beta-propeller domain-containing protein, partial [Pilimelia sp.]|nr:beta-propeller domain-containing protein [Pilimelia sp.]
MTRKPAAALVLLLALSGCTGDSDTPGGKVFQDPGVPTGALRLVAFDTCDDLLVGLRGAAKAAVGPWGFNNGGREMAAGGAVPDGARAAAPGGGTEDKAASAGSTSTYSKTNAHEAGADEPDLVKTDGRRIVTVAGGVVRVIDVASRRTSGSLDLAANLSGGRRPDAAPEVEAKLRAGFTNLLLAGDHVLLLGNGNFGYDLPATDSGGPGGVPGPDGKPILGTTVTLVDIAGPPKVVSSYTVDGGVLDARQIGSTARLVVRSAPRLSFDLNKSNPAERDQLAANKKVIDRAPLSDWLPRYSITDSAGKRTSGQVDCRSVHRPAEYSATALLTVLTFDLNRSTLDTGDPVSVVADGDTVYANGPSLYVANDKRWHTARLQIADGDPTAQPVVRATELYRFAISGAGKPRFAGGGKVDGWLLTQYSLSEWDGHLRVATTTDTQPGVARGAKSESAVHVLRADGTKLVEVGKVGGLGKGERIYSVRFVGPTGYVVTFRQTDPLYTLNLRDPKAPRVLGELKITGY